MKLTSKDLGVHQDSNSQSGSPLGSVGVHSFTPSHILGSMKCDFRASLFAYTFTSPCLGREPKAKVATMENNIMHHLYHVPTSKFYKFHGFIPNMCKVCYFMGLYCLHANLMHYLNIEVMCMTFLSKQYK